MYEEKDRRERERYDKARKDAEWNEFKRQTWAHQSRMDQQARERRKATERKLAEPFAYLPGSGASGMGLGKSLAVLFCLVMVIYVGFEQKHPPSPPPAAGQIPREILPPPSERPVSRSLQDIASAARPPSQAPAPTAPATALAVVATSRPQPGGWIDLQLSPKPLVSQSVSRLADITLTHGSSVWLMRNQDLSSGTTRIALSDNSAFGVFAIAASWHDSRLGPIHSVIVTVRPPPAMSDHAAVSASTEPSSAATASVRPQHRVPTDAPASPTPAAAAQNARVAIYSTSNLQAGGHLDLGVNFSPKLPEASSAAATIKLDSEQRHVELGGISLSGFTARVRLPFTLEPGRYRLTLNWQDQSLPQPAAAMIDVAAALSAAPGSEAR